MRRLKLADLTVAQRVFDRICGERGLDRHGLTAELLAAEILGLRGSGLEEEHEFLSVLRGKNSRF